MIVARLEWRDVTLTYPGATAPALDGVNFCLETGRLTALYGANGCGKSSLARVAAGLVRPDAGDVVRIGEPRPDGWNGMGYLSQYPDEQLLTGSVEDELAWGLENLNLPPAMIRERVEAAKQPDREYQGRL